MRKGIKMKIGEEENADEKIWEMKKKKK